MIIDWFTVAAQLANFAILVWLLKRFLYRPVLEAMVARENHVRETVAAAERQKCEAEEETRRLQGQQDALEQQKEGILQTAREQAASTRDELLAAAHQEAEERQAQWRTSLDRDWRALRSELIRRTQEEALAIARSALSELADVEIEDRMAAAFIKRLDALDVAALANGSPIIVRSGFALSKTLQDHLTESLRKRFDSETKISFEIHPEQIAGVEIVFDGHKIAWSFDDFLNSLERNVNDLIKQEAHA